ncbi:MAG: methyltransferase [Candidatus ainarchaeum sp.]|nr:methyltransferase [Candidatus ainarchaeum sp.]
MNKLFFTSETANKINKIKDKEPINFDLNKTKNKLLVEKKEAKVIINLTNIEKSEKSNKIEFDEKEFKNLKESFVYVIEDKEIKRIELFGEETNLYYKLLPTKDWPTLTLSSVPMHRWKYITPKEDTLSKIREISPVKGRVLDTCCGLGYTTISEASIAEVEQVDVFERDKNVLRICEYNPYSEQLFINKKIFIHNESVYYGIEKFKEETFDRIIHDPPTPTFAKELYSIEFYHELYRVLKKGGILYHYAPQPGKTKGIITYPHWIKLLEQVGFKKVKYNEKSSGIKAIK